MLSRRGFIKYSAITGAAVIADAGLAGCADSRGAQSSSASSSASQRASSSAASESTAASAASSTSSSAASSVAPEGSSIVVYFSHTGENYGVGYVEEGNTAIVADMIAEKAGAETFEIVPAAAYPDDYDGCCDVALDEKNSGARPAYVGDIDLSAYDTVYVGYPIWWGDLPMVVYTFIESHDWAGKQVLPFSTHAGSGLAGTEATLRSACSGATVGEGLSIAGTTAQDNRPEARSAVEAWMS